MGLEEVVFGPFRLDLRQRALSRAGASVRLGSRSLDILCTLVSAGGEVVTKDALMARVWPNQVIEDNALQVQVSALRKALEEGADGQSYVITVPGRGYRFAAPQLPPSGVPAPEASAPLSRSIAVLPFLNISSDPEQEYFADGMVEEIITSLSRIKWLFVIARNSCFVYKGKAIGVKQAALDLGVRYVVEGSVRKAGSRVRVTVQLIDAETGAHLWARRYDRLLDDIFALQDEITLRVVGAIEPSLRMAEIERARRKRPDSLDAYDLLLRAMPLVHSHIAQDAAAAIPALEAALRLEPGYPVAHAYLALCYHSRFSRGGHDDDDRAAAIYHARAASTDAVDDATALGISGFVIALNEHDQATAVRLFDRALALSSSDFSTLWSSALALAWMGKTDTAIERAQRALQLSPYDPLNFLAYNALAISYVQSERYGEAHEAARRSVQLSPRFGVSHSFLVTALVGLGRLGDAKLAAQRLLAIDPKFTVNGFATTVRIVPEVFDRFADAWISAGIPAA
jgi:TolB-like protein/cytochrome c-type biogenesis protein CcmH/NrfG